jgi:alpha-glucosidase (family GH31 glycosyl hydrolase)
MLAAVAFGGAVAPAHAATVVDLDAGAGSRLVVEDRPLRVVLRDRDGRELVSTFAGATGLPLRPPGIDGPLPVEPLGAAGANPALGWIAGARLGATMPVFLWAGNRLFGAEAGLLVAATEVIGTRLTPSGADLELATTVPGATARLQVQRLTGGGVRLRATPPPGIGVVSSLTTLRSPRGEGLYGLGGRKDRFDQRGLLRNVWVEQQNIGDERTEPLAGADPTGLTGREFTFPNGAQAAYYVQPALFGSRGWGAWAGGTALQRLDLAASSPEAVRWGVAEPELELTLAGAPEPGAATRAYTGDVGRPPAPPRYVYEPWIDVINEGEGEAAPNGYGFSGGARVAADLREIADQRDALGIPIGVLGIEGWQAVPDAERVFGDLRRRGLHLAGYWNPFTAPGTAAHAEATARGLFIRTATGAPFPIITSRNTVVNAIDFSNPEAAAFWARQLDRGRRLGIEAFMHDFGEFVTDGMVFADGRSADLEHNRYPTLLHRAARAAIDQQAAAHPGFKPWFYVRSGHTGTSAATSGVFPGDETTDWAEGSGLPSVIPAMLNLALGGVFTFSTDVGGYFDFVAPRTTPELLARWSQLAAFTPVMRVHNSTSHKSLLPWEAGPATLDVFRRYARAKSRLAPSVDRLSRRAADRGDLGPVRPLWFVDPSPAARSIDDQWMLGDDLLVAPVIRRGATSRRVYLPADSSWERVVVADDGTLAPTGDVQTGAQTVTAPAPLADIPIYRRVRPRCVSRRRFAITGVIPARLGRVSYVSVAVGGRRAVRVPIRGRRFRATVDLRGLPRGRVVVRIAARGPRGSRMLPSRVYRTCAPRARRPPTPGG